MRAKWVLLFLLILCTSSWAKDKAPLNLPYTDSGHIQYREVIEVPGVSAAEIMRRARLWMAKAYQSAPDVIKASEEGELVAKGVYEIPQGGLSTGTWLVRHTLTIEAKDGKARITLADFEVEWGERMGKSTALDSDGYQKAPNVPRLGFRSIFVGVDTQARAAIASLRAALSSAPESW